jgi:predicted PurR-regulated permease PerM
MEVEDLKIRTPANTSQRIIALGIVIAFLYWASSIVMTLLLAILLAYFLDPVVELLTRIKIPRALGAFFVLIGVMALFGWLGYLMVDRADQFVAAWPKYSAILRHAAAALNKNLLFLQKQVDAIAPDKSGAREPLQFASLGPVRDIFLHSLGSLYAILPMATFLPFLVYFMLAAKNRVWQATMNLFATEDQPQVKDALDEVSSMLRSYVAGNFLISVILVLASWAFFLKIDLQYPFITGVASGLLNMIPYLGAVLSWLPPFLIGMGQWSTIGPYLGVGALLMTLHLLGMNVLMPAIVGRRVHLSPLAVTIALLFWGWIWGAVGLILAIPITAAIKVVCDHMEEWEPLGRWLGA